MKKLSTPYALTGVCAATGFLCFFLRLWLFGTGVDEKGLLISSHPGSLLSWLLTAAVAVFLAFCLWKKAYTCRFAASALSVIGTLAAAIGFGAAGWVLLGEGAGVLALVTGIAGILAAICAVLTALCHHKKLQPNLFVRFPAIVFFMLFLVSRYQLWSAEPQFQHYGFQLFALVCLMLSTYQRAALQAGSGSAVAYLVASCGAVFFCLSAIPGSSLAVFYLAMAAAIVLDGCHYSRKHPQGV